MDTTEPNKLNDLVATIWGKSALEGPPDPAPEVREFQNHALSIAIRLYLQSYLDDMGQAAARVTDGIER